MKKFKEKTVEFLKKDWPLLVLILISLVLHIAVLIKLGYKYSLNSDDASYIKSGIVFFKTGKITMHGVISAQIMPGMTFLIALFASIFGTGAKLIMALKIFWMIMGILTIIVVYETIRLHSNKYISCIPCLLLLTIDYIWMDNLILTETPFILLFSLLIYHTLKLPETKSKKDCICIITYYILAIFIRPNIVIFPIFLIIYLLVKKYPFKLLLKQCIIGGLVLILFLIPWTYRNYKVFGKFIPLSYGVGNPLLLGTYQGYGYPIDEELDYESNVTDKMSKEMRHYLTNTEEKPHMTWYYLLEKDGMKARYRMKEWWKRDKKSMIKSYLFEKPKILLLSSFYWDTVFKINIDFILLLRKIELIVFAISILLLLILRQKIKELIFLILVYGSQIALYSYTFAFSRYAQSLFFIRYIIIGLALGVAFNKVLKWRSKDESINNNTSL